MCTGWDVVLLQHVHVAWDNFHFFHWDLSLAVDTDTDFAMDRKINYLVTPKNCQFEKYIYPKELELKKTTESPQQCSYLDLNM